MTWAPDYATLDELKAFVRVNDTDDDAVLAPAITAASRAIDRAANRQFGKTDSPEDRFYTAYWDRHARAWFVDVDDIPDVTGLTVHFDTDDSGDYADMVVPLAMKPVNALQVGRPFTKIMVGRSSVVQPSSRLDAIEVHALYGWSAVPAPVKEATLLQASRLVRRRDSPFGIAGSPEIGSELRLLAKLDADVDVIVRGYYRGWWAR